MVLLNLQAFLVDGEGQARTSCFALYLEHSFGFEEVCDIERGCFSDSHSGGEQEIDQCQVSGCAVLTKHQLFFIRLRVLAVLWFRFELLASKELASRVR